MSKKYLIAFASPDLQRSVSRFYDQAEKIKFYDEICIFKIDDINLDYKKKILDLINKRNKKRGYGYWFWKPLIILQLLKKIQENDIINYVDIGCHINLNGVDRLKHYIKKLQTSEKGILGFQYYPLKDYDNKNFKFPIPLEYRYSKADLLKYFNVLEKKEIISTPQYWSGNIFLLKNKFTISFINKWLKVFDERFDLVDDTPSNIKNFDDFVHNQHDQSVFSILSKLEKVESLSAYECEWFYHNGTRYWEHTKNNPIIAKRDLQYNLFKRFLIRQKRTFNRYRAKLFKN
tara:strand:- start:192 stop:1058 length:867 start_codon:yes stop_codon:yes gene_type:complete